MRLGQSFCVGGGLDWGKADGVSARYKVGLSLALAGLKACYLGTLWCFEVSAVLLD